MLVLGFNVTATYCADLPSGALPGFTEMYSFFLKNVILHDGGCTDYKVATK